MEAIPYNTPTTPKPLGERVNIRLIIVGLVVAVLVGWPVYVFVHEKMTGGIERLANGLVKVDLKAMSVFPFDQTNGTVDQIPPQWRELDGKKVVVLGEQWQPFQAGDKVGGFQLCYSIAKCCFSGPPQVQHFVNATVSDPKAKVDYYGGQMVKVVGTLHVNVKRDEGKVSSVYQMDVDSVEPM